MRISNIIGGVCVTLEIILPDAWADHGKIDGKVIWLLHDEGESAETWMLNLPAEALANEMDAAMIIPSMGFEGDYGDHEPGCTWETFFTQGLWDYAHEMLPSLSQKAMDQLLFGRGAGAEAAKRYAEKYPDRFGSAVGCMPDGGGLEDWLACVSVLRKATEELLLQA